MNTRIEPDSLISLLEREYALPAPLQCEFIRRGFNDHYRVMAGDVRFVLRVYLNGKYYISGPADFRFELELLRFLHQRGVSVSHPLPRRDGDLLGSIATEGGERCCALFTVAAGDVAEPVSPAQARALGATVAAFHTVANQFQSLHPRYHLDLEYLLERPIREIAALLRQHGRGDLAAYESLFAELRRAVRETPLAGDAYGIIHGDLHDHNIHFTAQDQPTLFDFDHGGYGWRAYDLAVSKLSLSEEAWRTFLESYEESRPISDAERELIPVFARIRPIWDRGDILSMYTAWGKEEAEEGVCDRTLEMLAQVATGTG